MATYKIAHIREQGNDMIIIPLEWTFENEPPDEQQEIIADLQRCAIEAGLAGIVVVVWRSGSTHKFIGPQPWHPFLSSVAWNDIIASLNKELTCG